MESVRDEEYRGYMIRIQVDEDPIDPRKEFDNLGHMVCWHQHYNLGDEQPGADPHEWAKHNLKDEDVFYEPLYLYDHSGITMGIHDFNDRWDSGQVGWIYVKKEDVRKEWGVKRISPKLRHTVYANLMAEVKTYDAYISGEVYGWEIFDPEDEGKDGVWGYYGYDEMDYMITEAKAAVDGEIVRVEKEKQEQHEWDCRE